MDIWRFIIFHGWNSPLCPPHPPLLPHPPCFHYPRPWRAGGICRGETFTFWGKLALTPCSLGVSKNRFLVRNVDSFNNDVEENIRTGSINWDVPSHTGQIYCKSGSHTEIGSGKNIFMILDLAKLGQTLWCMSWTSTVLPGFWVSQSWQKSVDRPTAGDALLIPGKLRFETMDNGMGVSKTFRPTGYRTSVKNTTKSKQ